MFLRSGPVAAICLRAHVPEGEKCDHACMGLRALTIMCLLMSMCKKNTDVIPKRLKFSNDWKHGKTQINDYQTSLNKEQCAFITLLPYLFPVANILSFSLIILCECFQNEQTNPDGREQSRLTCIEHYVILRDGWKKSFSLQLRSGL